MLSAFLFSYFALSPIPVLAQQSFDALCDKDVKCKVVIGDLEIIISSTSIPSSKILKWQELEAESKRKPELCLLSLTACALIIFHDYKYSIEYAGDDGTLQVSQFRFVNDKPAKKIASALTALTNLASGQANTNVLALLQKREKEVEYEKMIASLDCSPVIKPFKCSYNAYLEATPGAKAWAQANPSLAKSQMVHMKAVETVPQP
jgi:hypothetical protein